MIDPHMVEIDVELVNIGIDSGSTLQAIMGIIGSILDRQNEDATATL